MLYLEKKNTGRFLTLDKRRFETEITTYEFESRYTTFEAVDILGTPQEVKCVYGWPVPVEGESATQSTESREAEVFSKVIEIVKAGSGLNQTEVCKAVGVKKSIAIAAITRGVDAGSILIEPGPNGSRLHFYNEGTPF